MSSSVKAALIGTLFLGISAQCHATLDDAARAIAAGDPGHAMERLQAMPPSERDSYRGRLLHAEALAAQGRREEATRIYRDLIDEVPAQPESYNNLAVLYAAEGRLDEALALLEQAMNTNASYATVRANLGRIYLEKSLSSYAKALQVGERDEPPSLQALYQLNGPEPAADETLVLAAAEQSQQTDDSGKTAPEAERIAVIESAQAPALNAPAPTVPEPVAVPDSAEDEPLADADTRDLAAATVEAGESASAGLQGENEALAGGAAGIVEPADAAPEAVSDSRQAVLEAVARWAKSWQEQDIETYLAAYAVEFSPSHGISHEQWQAQRRQRLSKPERIEVALEEIESVFSGADHARVTFLQRYRSDRYRDTTRKRLRLVNQDGAWKIVTEKTLEVIQ